MIKFKGVCCLRENEGYGPDLEVAWGRAKWKGALEGYSEELKNRLTPFLNNLYSSVQEIGSEIGQVSSVLIECRLHTLPLTNGRKRNARKVWVKAG